MPSAYVEWDQTNDSDAIMEQLNKGETPAGVRIVDYQSAGIDPYEFLSR